MYVTQWIIRGYADRKEGTPAKRAPNYPEEILYLIPENDPPQDVVEYWQGWDAGNIDSLRKILQEKER